MLRRALRLAELQRRALAQDRAVIPGTVLYESFAGHGALDNPEALFRRLIGDPEFAGLRHLWSLDAASGAAFRAEFSADRRVRFVRPRSAAYLTALARSQYLVTNATFPPEFRKRPGQTVLNTWHGTPLKHMGYDMPDGAYEAANTLRNFLASDFLLSQNAHMTRMYRESYRLDGIFAGRILELGYPRTDRQTLDPDQRARIRDQLGIAADDHRRLVVFAPTWKGTSFASPRDDAERLGAVTRELQDRLGDGFLVVLKAHQAVHDAVAGHRAGRGPVHPVVSNDIPTNALLGITEVLITDYSSIFIDFLSTRRPIVFFTPDRDEYSRERGTYFSPDELPGPVVTTVHELAEAIRAPRRAREQAAERWRSEFTAHDDGGASDRVIDAVFRSAAPAEPTPAASPRPRRRSILLYLGGMRSNGITTSALNLLAHLDHERLDVSVVLARPRTREQRENASRIDARVRQFHRVGGLTDRVSTEFRMRVAGRLWAAHREAAWERRLWHREWQRIFGDAGFDAVIDFSGYSRFWSELILHSPPARRLVWLHNDMVAEVDRPVGGRRAMRRSLPAVFALYPRFDALVSVSNTLSSANAAGLAERYGIPREKFLSARNAIDEIAVRERLREPLADAATVVDAETGEVGHPEWPNRLAVERSATGRGSQTRWFVTVGRLSPEKNQARLLEAFARVHVEHPDTGLIVVGDGPLRDELEQRRDALGLGDAVIMTGALANPFPVLAASDCFVLSSDYEGQPMVLLEAAVAGLPIVTVDFRSVDDAVPGDRLHVVEQTVDGLAAGMIDYLDGEVGTPDFDPEEYNALVLREFVAAIRSDADPSPSNSPRSSAREISARSAIAPRSNNAATAIDPTTTPTVHHMSASSTEKRSSPGR